MILKFDRRSLFYFAFMEHVFSIKQNPHHLQELQELDLK